MLNFSFLLDDAADSGSGGTSWIPTLIMIAVLFLIFWLFMIRPQKKQEQKDNEMRDALAVGDEVTTIGGVIGKVVSIKGETFVLETTRDRTKIRFLKAAVRSVDVKAADIAAAVIAEENAKNATENSAPAEADTAAEAADAKAESVADASAEGTDTENK